MTIKEFSELLDVSIDTVTRAAKSIFPNRFSQGKAAVFNVAESKQIIAAIKHKGILTQNAVSTAVREYESNGVTVFRTSRDGHEHSVVKDGDK